MQKIDLSKIKKDKTVYLACIIVVLAVLIIIAYNYNKNSVSEVAESTEETEVATKDVDESIKISEVEPGFIVQSTSNIEKTETEELELQDNTVYVNGEYIEYDEEVRHEYARDGWTESEIKYDTDGTAYLISTSESSTAEKMEKLEFVDECTEHEWVKDYGDNKPTCLNKGYYTMICKKCGAAGSSGTAEKLAHDYQPVVLQEGSCSKLEVIAIICTNCGGELEREASFTDEHGETETVKVETYDEITDSWITVDKTVCKDCGAEIE
jgi:hypothetical protein